MHRYSLGIDTGGTYTDAVIIDASTRRLLAKAKALTTKGDLAIGVAEAMRGVLAADASGVSGADIGIVALSTTLATNAIVEGHGSAIAIVFIGFDEAMIGRSGVAGAIPGVRIGRVSGGHDHAGDEVAALDVVALSAFVRDAAPHVEAFAVASHYSVRNSAHEERARDVIGNLCGMPTTLSGELAQDLDAPRRALTAALNARIVTRIVALIGAARVAMADVGVTAPLMIVKGDGALGAAEAIAHRPIETILSGPAASVIGAKFLSGLSDFIIADIGGTTTDAAIVENGWPRLNREGAAVGGRRTMVRAIDMRTFALGGDSEVDIGADSAIVLGPRRVTPLSLLATRHPSVLRAMRAMFDDPDHVPYAGRFALRPFGAAEHHSALPGRQSDLMARIGEAPVPLGALIHSPAMHRALDRLVAQGLAQIAAFTPSDAAHVLGLQGQWSREAAALGAALLLRWRTMAPLQRADDAATEALARRTVDAVAAMSVRAIIETLGGDALRGASALVDAVASGQGRAGALRVSLGPFAPIVAVGGPAAIYYPEVGRRLRADIVLPPDGDVANAIGAAVGVVKARVMIEITHVAAGYRVHHASAPQTFADGAQALNHGRALAENLARDLAMRSGGAEASVHVHVDRIDIPSAPSEHSLVAATIIAEAWADPQPRS